jgi:alpha-ketoglutarate-dependent taurine dioxygenase
MADLQVRELHPGFGAEITGLRPEIPLDDDTTRQLRDLFDERGLLVFPDLDIDPAFQRYLAHLLIGQEPPAESPPVKTPDGATRREFMFVSNKEPGGGAPYGRLLFHLDMMWSERPHQALSLYGVDVEQPNVPTMFVSMGHGWDTLPDDLRNRVDGLHAVHGHDATYPNRGGDDDVIDSVFDQPKKTTTLVAHPHPRTGRTMLYVSQQVTLEIEELSPEENEELLEALFAHLYDPARVVEHNWRNGDLVIWDNQAIQHARPNVRTDAAVRTLRKVFAPIPEPLDPKLQPRFSKVG